MPECSVDECHAPAFVKGLCKKHYLRHYRHGDTDRRRGGTEEERFWRNVIRSDPGECWEWKARGAKYGLFRHLGGTMEGAHRASYRLNIGPIPTGKLVLHRCDNPRCVNPAHLFVGSPQDNMDDMDRKGRRKVGAKRGTECSFARLNEEAVRFIRAHPEQTHVELGAQFGVTPNTIRAVRIGKSWGHLT